MRKQFLVGLCVMLGILGVGLGTPNAARSQGALGRLIILMDGDLWAYDRGANTLTQLTRWGYNQPPVMSPNGRYAAYTSVAEIAINAVRQFPDSQAAPASNVWIWDLQSGASARVGEQPPGASYGTGPNDMYALRGNPVWSPDGGFLAWLETTVGPSLYRLELVIYDVANSRTKTRTEVQVAGQPAALGPKWGAAGLAVRAASAPNVEGDSFLFYDNNGSPRGTAQIPSDGQAVFDFTWAMLVSSEYLGVSYTNGAWKLINPVNFQVLAAPGLAELYSKTAPNPDQSLRAFYYPSTSGVAWAAAWGGAQYGLNFGGFPSQIAPSPDGNALAFVTDAVYIFDGPNATLTRVPGTERIAVSRFATVAWAGQTAWRIANQPGQPAPAPTSPVLGGSCPGAPPARLAPGMVARVTSFPNQSNALNSAPGRPSRNPGIARITLIPVGGVFTVLNGPACVDGYAWWQVNYQNYVGWTAEGEGGVYWLEPYDIGAGACPPALPPRLIVGALARVTPGDPNALRAQPSKDNRVSPTVGVIPGGGIFTVINGPVCADGYAWWQASYQGVVGWTPEGEGATYWLEPLTCGLQVPSRLSAGQFGRVTPGLPNALRSQPSRDRNFSAILGEIPPGGIFRIIQGPQCGDGLAWWQVDYQGIIGWTAEGQGTTYWLEPVR
jgi:hypothetical protein